MNVKKFFKLVLMAVLIGLGVFTSSVVNAYSEEVEKWTKIIEANPNDYMAYYNRGLAFIEMGRAAYSMSLPDFSKAIEIDPNYAVPYRLRANCYYHLGECQLAIDDYKKEAELKNDYRGLEDSIERCRQKMNAQG